MNLSTLHPLYTNPRKAFSGKDYYPGGMVMQGRNFSSEKYRFGFNSKESDNEVYGTANFEDYGMRMYNPRLVRFPSVDPLTFKYPWYSPYQFAGNSPISHIDIDGLEEGNNNKPGENINGINTAAIDQTARRNLFLNEPSQFNTGENKEAVEKMSILLIPEVLTPSAEYIAKQTFKNGCWIGATSKGELKLFNSTFYGNQAVKKTAEYSLRLTNTLTLGTWVIHGLVIGPSAYKALTSEDPTEKMEAIDEFNKSMVMLGIELVNTPAGIAVTVADQIMQTDEFKNNQIQNAREKSEDYGNKNNFKAYRRYENLKKSRDVSHDEVKPRL
ncbi:MAG: RHS repeat-associated core domain-containing protein [Chitinophagales bacterium]